MKVSVRNAVKLAVRVAAVGLLCAVPTLRAQTQAIPPLVPVPNALDAANRERFTRERERLQSVLRAFQADANAFNTKDAKAQSDQEYDDLMTRRTDYIRSATAYNQQVDSSVVNAMGVPSGLPPGVDRAIAAGFGSAPAGISDRVRKGFQAVMAHDWKVAWAWFADALNRDPENRGLKRLVALTDFASSPSSLPSTATIATSQPAMATARAPGGAAQDHKLDGWLDAQLEIVLRDFFRNYLPKHPELLPPGQVVVPSDQDLDLLFGAPLPWPPRLGAASGPLVPARPAGPQN